MECIVKRRDLLRGLEAAKRIIQPDATMGVLRWVHLRCVLSYSGWTLQLIAGDWDVLYAVEYPCIGNATAGGVALDCKEFWGIVRSLKADQLRLQGDTAKWQVLLSDDKGGGCTTFFGTESSGLPEFPCPPTSIVCAGSDLSDAIRRMDFSIATDDSGYGVNGAYLERLAEKEGGGLRLASTDGRRLSYAHLPYQGDVRLKKNYLLPRKGMQELKKMTEQYPGLCYLGFDHARCYASSEGALLSMRLLEGDFPHYRKALPKVIARTLRVQRDVLLAALQQQCKIIKKNKWGQRIVKLTHRYVTQGLHIAPAYPDGVDRADLLSCTADPKLRDDRIVGINLQYLLDVVEALSCPEILLDMYASGELGVNSPTPAGAFYCIGHYRI